MCEKHWLKRHFFDDARFARRDLADDGDKNWSTLTGDRGHLHRHIEVFQSHVTMAFPKWPFRLKPLTINQSLNHDFGIGRNMKIDSLGFDNPNRITSQTARYRHFILVNGEFLRSGKQNHRGAAN